MTTISRTTAAVKVNTFDQNEAYSSVAALAEGGYVVVWSSYAPYEYSATYDALITVDKLYGARFDAGGRLISDFRIDELDAPTRQNSKPAAAGLTDGGFAVMWREENLGYYTNQPSEGSVAQYIYNRTYDTNSLPDDKRGFGITGQYNNGFQQYFTDPAIAPGPDDTFATASAYRYDLEIVSSLEQRGGEPVVNDRIATDTDETLGGVAVVALADGYATIWALQNGDGDQTGIVMRVLDSNGAVVVTRAQVNTSNVGLQYMPAAVALETGGFVVTWASLGSSADEILDVKGQRFNDLGQRVGGEFRVNTTTAGSQFDPAMAAFDDGGFVVVWQSDTRVVAQRFAASGAKAGTEIIVGDTAGNSNASVTALTSGRFVVSWSRDQDGDGDPDIVSRTFLPAVTNSVASAAMEIIHGTSGADALTAAPGVFRAGDQVDLMGGADQLRLSAAGALDLSAPERFSGVETIVGTAGNDTLIVSSQSLRDVTSIFLGAGVNVLKAVGTFVLKAGLNVTDIQAAVLTGMQAYNYSGNEFSQKITGNAGANWIFGFGGDDTLTGGRGGDRLYGGLGNDRYFVDTADDRVFEETGEGADTVLAAASFTLETGSEIELLRTSDDAGAAAIALTGNAFAQSLIGNAGANRLDGRSGADRMSGLRGDDAYIVDDSGDRVIETADAGTDRVYSSVSFTLSANVETLILTEIAAANGAGNALANNITGNVAANVLSGGDGMDRLTGGSGGDTFLFNTAPSATNIDRILDFSVADDTIALENAVFRGLPAGALRQEAFHIGRAAHDADDRIIYNSELGRLSFDPDGNGAAAAQQFAIIATGLAMTEADFGVL